LNNPYIAEKEKRLAQRIASRFPRHGTNLLEIGCGEGSNLHYLRQELPHTRITGLDFSSEKIDFLQSVYDDVLAVCGDATNLPFGDAEYDLVLCRDLLHHIYFARKRVLSEVFRVVRHGGVVIIIESDGRRLLNRVFRALCPAERGMRFSRPEMLSVLTRGFGTTELEYIEASFLIRACAFFWGWPERLIQQRMVSACYYLARLWERGVEAFLPKSHWTYMMITVRKS